MARRRNIQYKRGDSWPPLDDVVSDRNGPMDLSGALSARFLMRLNNHEGVLQVDAAAVLGNDEVPATEGGIRYLWAVDGSDLAIAGTYVGEWEITWLDGVATAPNGQGDYLEIVVSPDLGGTQ
ncbi:MAG TPA: hypothetical protein VIY86_04540 [Pirellulaceae bacterium]